MRGEEGCRGEEKKLQEHRGEERGREGKVTQGGRMEGGGVGVTGGEGRQVWA